MTLEGAYSAFDFHGDHGLHNHFVFGTGVVSTVVGAWQGGQVEVVRVVNVAYFWRFFIVILVDDVLSFSLIIFQRRVTPIRLSRSSLILELG